MDTFKHYILGFIYGLQFNKGKFSNCYNSADSILSITTAIMASLTKIYNLSYIAVTFSLFFEINTFISGAAVYCKLNQLAGVITTSVAEGISGLVTRVGVSSLSTLPGLLSEFLSAVSTFESGIVIGEIFIIVFNFTV